MESIETMVAFVNSKGGSLYIGVNDDGNVSRTELGKETVAQWLNEIKCKTIPMLLPDVDIIDVDGKSVVMLSIQDYPIKPVSVRGKYFKRVGNQLVQ